MSIFTIADFSRRFPNETTCIEAIKRLRFPRGIFCPPCRKITRHYKVKDRTAYSCRFCRTQAYPLKGTIFEKTTTPLRLWFYAMYLMTQTRGQLSAKQLQRELGVTYKTAWRIRTLLMKNNQDLLSLPKPDEKVHKWLFFNKIEFKVAEKKVGN